MGKPLNSMTADERKDYIELAIICNEDGRRLILNLVHELRRDEGVMVDVPAALREIYEQILRAETAMRMIQ